MYKVTNGRKGSTCHPDAGFRNDLDEVLTVNILTDERLKQVRQPCFVYVSSRKHLRNHSAAGIQLVSAQLIQSFNLLPVEERKK